MSEFQQHFNKQWILQELSLLNLKFMQNFHWDYFSSFFRASSISSSRISCYNSSLGLDLCVDMFSIGGGVRAISHRRRRRRRHQAGNKFQRQRIEACRKFNMKMFVNITDWTGLTWLHRFTTTRDLLLQSLMITVRKGKNRENNTVSSVTIIRFFSRKRYITFINHRHLLTHTVLPVVDPGGSTLQRGSS